MSPTCGLTQARAPVVTVNVFFSSPPTASTEGPDIGSVTGNGA